jgi:hypothetical protein
VNDIPILVCGCGKRLRAPGAKPGRMGRCPSCGGTMRVPEPSSTSRRTEPSRDRSNGSEVDPTEWPTTSVTAPSRKKKKRRRSGTESGHETAIWDGFVKAPTQLETTIQESLLYPLWGAQGVVLLTFFPPVLWLISLVVIAIGSVITGPTLIATLPRLLVLLPFAAALGAVLGFVLLYLGKVLAATAVGEIHPPRWPELDLSSVVFGMGRWLWAGFAGGVIGGIPAVLYWIKCGDVDVFDAVVIAELLAVGAVYALMALLAAILHEELWAANPISVLKAIRRVGWSYAQPCLLSGFACVPAITVLMAAFKVSNPLLSAFLLWFFWVLTLYEAMVVFRVFGLFYHRHARVLGWFRGRTRWGV